MQLTPTDQLVSTSKKVASTSSTPARGDARIALLDATLALVRKQGWAATSLDQLCRRAGVTKGAFFHHFASKEDLGVAAARHWGVVTAPLFAHAGYHRHDDPLARLMAYLDFRAALAEGPLEAITCFAGTTVQETFASSNPIRAACGTTITEHAATLEADFRAALAVYPPRDPVTAESLALHTQAVLQGAFVIAKAMGHHGPVGDAVAHLKRYLALLFQTHADR
jgi:TetR/AcrR family transcriptional regulator, transcriptional repressor for nem operon